MRYTTDFETNTNEESCKNHPVWGVGICEINDTYKFYHGNSIEWFFEFISLHDGDTFYFHNLKFDGDFIFSYLLKNGYSWVKNKKEMTPKTFSCLISDKNQFYSIDIAHENGSKVSIWDSLKIIPLRVDKIAESFGLPISKLEIDYNEVREKGHELTNEEIAYLKSDVEICARALSQMFEQNLTKMTLGSSALAEYKQIITPKKFDKLFPKPQFYIDQDLRSAYKGGFTYCSPRTQCKDLGKGIVLDVNSLYPSVMCYNHLPYGEGIYFDGEYKEDKNYPLYIIRMSCAFELRKDKIPTLQLKNNLAFCPTEYLHSSEGEEIVITMTNIDYKIFKEHYHIYNPEFIGGWKYRAKKGMFKEYIKKWNGLKVKAHKENNKGLRQIAKLMLNNLYGKFALNPVVQGKIPYLKDGVVKYQFGEKEEREPIYIPMGIFITSWARYKTITSAQKCYSRFAYADTDSLHLIGIEIPKELEISETDLGAWKIENKFSRARFLRQKTYIEEINGKLEITCAGMPDRCYPNVTWENFHIGNSFEGRLQQKHVDGGIILLDKEFTIKEG